MKIFYKMILEISIVLCFISVIIYQAKEIEYLKQSFAPYTIGNYKNYRRLMLIEDMPIYNKIAEKYGVSAYTLAAIGIKENLNNLYSHGVKKIPEKSLAETSPREWQKEACAKIVKEELIKYVYENDERLLEFYILLGKRYCPHDYEYGKIIFNIHKEIEKRR